MDQVINSMSPVATNHSSVLKIANMVSVIVGEVQCGVCPPFIIHILPLDID